MLSADYSKRGYLLPKGCKDLIDVINLQKSAKLQWPWQVAQSSTESPPVTGAIVVREGISVGEFAALLGQKPFKIIADLMELGIFASLKQVVDFETMRRLARKYGYEAKREA